MAEARLTTGRCPRVRGTTWLDQARLVRVRSGAADHLFPAWAAAHALPLVLLAVFLVDQGKAAPGHLVGSGGRIASTRSRLFTSDQISSAMLSGEMTGNAMGCPLAAMMRCPADRSMSAPMVTVPA